MEIQFARSATRHRVSRLDSVHVIELAQRRFRIGRADPSEETPESIFLFVGDDRLGRPTEVIAVEIDIEKLLVIHAMPLRSKYQLEYDEEMKWRST